MIKQFKGFYYLIYFVMKLTNALIILLVLSSLGSSQISFEGLFTGGRMRHLYTQNIQVIPGDNTIIFTPENVFDQSEDIFIATALTGISSYRGIVDTTSPSIEITSTVNAGKTGVTVHFNHQNQLGINTTVERININLIAIGSGFSGYYDNVGVASSYLFARNGLLTREDLGVTNVGLFDFSLDEANPGPFNYDPVNNTGCGARKHPDGYWRVEVQDCALPVYNVFLTGFSGPRYPNEIANNILFNTQATVLNSLTLPPSISIDPLTDGLRVQLLDNRDGGFYQRIQLSFVFVGLREYGVDSYPQQSLYMDDFALINLREEIPAVGVIATNIQMNTIDAVYDEQTNSEVGHIFCGFSQIQLQYISASTSLYSFDFAGVTLGGANPNTAHFITSPANQLEFGRAEYSCIMITDNNPCDESLSELIIDAQNSPVVVKSSSSITDTYRQGTLTEFDHSLGVDVTFGSIGEIVLTLNYKSVENKAYEGQLQVTVAGAIAADQIFSAKFEVFGEVIYHVTSRKDFANNGELGALLSSPRFGLFNFGTSNSVTLTLSFDYHGVDTTNGIQMSIDLGIHEHGNVLNDGECASSCSNTAGKSIGVDFSQIPPVCLFCDTTILNELFNPTTGECECEQGQVEVSGVCTPCNDPLCQDCLTSDLTACSQCAPNSQSASDQAPCLCNSGYFKTQNEQFQFTECLACPRGCVTCTSRSSCGSCVESTTRLSASQGCACQVGYFEVDADECAECSSQCQECKQSATKCTACDEAGHFQLQGTTCTCVDGYFKVLGTQTTCQPCDTTCKTCKDTAGRCTECHEDTRELNGNGQCVCKEGFTEFQGSCKDTQCSSVDVNCATCYILLGDGSVHCQTCSGNHRVLVNNTCVCGAGYYDNGGVCIACGDGCQSCLSSVQCTECALESYNNMDGTCTCAKGTHLVNIDNTLYCRPCDDNCAACFGTTDNCTQCLYGYSKSDTENRCICKVGSYETEDLTRCLPCMSECVKCSSANECETCSEYSAWDGYRCVKECPLGTFNQQNECKQCSDYCSNCSSSYNCQTCFNGYYKYAGACRPQCPMGTFPDFFQCVACASPCATCSGSAYTCTSCEAGFILLNGECLINCPDGTFFTGATCLSCSNNCFNCDQTADNCVSCPAGKYLVNGRCDDTCPQPLVNGICTTNCPTGTFLDGTKCSPCSGECGSCGASADDCKTCINNLLTYNGDCVSSCPANTIQIETACIDCDVSCNGCSINPFSCHSCQPGYYHLSGRCINACPEGYYTDYSQQTCRQCDANCKICNGPGQCQVCDDLTSSPVNQCDNQCGANCLKCEENVCVQCAEGTLWTGILCISYCPSGSQAIDGVCVCDYGFMHQNQCVTRCPAGFVSSGASCVQCSAECLECANTPSQCTACADGLQLDIVSGRCEATNECAFGNYRDPFGQCKLICPTGSYFFDSTCFFGECPPGYKVDKVNQACIEDQIPSGCTIPKFLQGRVCVDNCSPGYYPNLVNRVCEACSSGCFSCLSASYCISCNTGFELKDNECVLSESCGDGTYKYQSQCLPSCPLGTFARNGFCLRECPAGTKKYQFGCYDTCLTLSTPDACVSSCPIGFTQDGNDCVLNTQTCSLGQYFNALSNQCQACSFPCKTCTGSRTSCLSCQNGYVLDGSICKQEQACQAGKYLSGNSCVDCPEKCGTCINGNDCTSCASGYVNTGSDCIKNSNVLQSVQIQVVSVTQRDNVVTIQTLPSALPNDMPTSIQNTFYLVLVENVQADPVVTVWVQAPYVYAALKYPNGIPTTDLVYLVVNSSALKDLYMNMGYVLTEGFAQANINRSLPATPSSVQISSRSFKSTVQKSTRNINRLQSRVMQAIRASRVLREIL